MRGEKRKKKECPLGPKKGDSSPSRKEGGGKEHEMRHFFSLLLGRRGKRKKQETY